MNNKSSYFILLGNMNIRVIGYGHMAQALCEVWRQNPDYHLYVSAPSLKMSQIHPRLYGFSSNIVNLDNADLLVLAVKPAQMLHVLTEIRDHLPQHLGIISVAAGLNFAWFQSYLPPNTAVVRAMPNLAAQCHNSATPLIANSWVSIAQKTLVNELFQQCGLLTWISKEEDLDIYTALSGSGLAYIYAFANAMLQAATHLGLEEKIAQAFTLQTLKGATSLACLHNQTWSDLQNIITSKAGTTAAALDVFATHHLDDLVLNAMQAAMERAKALRIKE